MRLFLNSLTAIALLCFATSAHALRIEISESSDFSGAIFADDTDNDGRVTIDSGIGSWLINVVVGLSSPAIGDESVDKLDLFSVNVSGGAGTLYIRLTDTDFSRYEAQYTTAYGGTTDGTVSFQTWMDATNTEFGQGTLLSDSGVVPGLAFSGQDSGGINVAGPYSISIYAAVTHSGSFQASSFDYAVAVPEPGTLALIGLGLMGLGLLRRRQPHAVQRVT